MPPTQSIKEAKWLIDIHPPILFKTIDYALIGVFIAQRKRLSHPGSDQPRPSPWVVKAPSLRWGLHL